MRQYKVKAARVFDTQIAHRMLVKSEEKLTYKDNNVSLNSLLNIYLGTENTMKSEISSEMAEDPSYWEHRPLTPKMIAYASQDVIFLPKVFEIFRGKLRASMVTEVFTETSQ